MRNPFKTIVVNLVGLYGKLAIKPFKNSLRKLYLKQLEPRMKENKIAVAEIDGIKYRVDLNIKSGVEMYYGRGYEPFVSAVVDRFVKTGMAAVDIGANIGIHTCRLAKDVGQEGKVIAFEPDEKNIEKLKHNLKLNNLNNVIIRKEALSETNPLNLKERVDFIKIDTDGYEYKIIKASSDLIRKYKPKMVVEFCKFSLAWHNNTLDELIDLLYSLDYSLYSLNNLKRLTKESLFALYEKTPPIPGCSLGAVINVLCLSNES